MLYFLFKLQGEPLGTIEVRLNFFSSGAFEHMTKCNESLHLVSFSIMTHDWILWVGLINNIPLLDLISYILWFDSISFSLWYGLIKSSVLIWSN